MKAADIHWAASAIIGILAALGSWAYAIASYGWFLGGGLGWIPAAFIGIITAFIWPVIVGGLVLVILWGLGLESMIPLPRMEFIEREAR